MQIYELDKTIVEYLKSRQLLSQYSKKKKQLLLNQNTTAQFKKRRPFHKEVF